MTGTLLDWPLMSVSIFNAVTMFWLGLTVLLNAARRTWGTWLIGGGLLGGALFFVSHSAILGIGRDFFSQAIDLWWRLGWPPLIFLPLAWYLAFLWFGGFPEQEAYRRRHRQWAAAAAFFSFALFASLFVPDLVPSFSQLARLNLTSPVNIAGIPLIVIAFPLYILFCTGLSIAALLDRQVPDRSSHAPGQERAFPWLVAGSITLLAVSLVVSGTLSWVVYRLPEGVARPEFEGVLAWLDLLISSLIALTALFVGQAIVAYEVFTGFILPRGGLRRGWRRLLALAAGYSLLVGAATFLALDPVYSLLLTALIMTAFFALLLWRSFQERAYLLEQVRPFLASQGLYTRMLGGEPGPDLPRSDLAALAKSLLGIEQAFLLPTGAYSQLVSGLAYPTGAEIPASLKEVSFTKGDPFRQLTVAGSDQPLWAIDLWPGASAAGMLFLGPKRDGSLFVMEELEIAQAAAERILDSAAGAELARRLALVQKERLMESQVADQRTRRILHDQVLPQLHALLLSIERDHPASDSLAGIHRQVSDLLSSMPPATSPTFERMGLLSALRSLLVKEFSGYFDSARLDSNPDAEACIARLTRTEAEVVYYAVREAIRNAARHARGAGPLHLQVEAECPEPDLLSVVVHDDGIGYSAGESLNDRSRGGQGLLLHSALVAVIGGALSVEGLPRGGTAVRISLPLKC